MKEIDRNDAFGDVYRSQESYTVKDLCVFAGDILRKAGTRDYATRHETYGWSHGDERLQLASMDFDSDRPVYLLDYAAIDNLAQHQRKVFTFQENPEIDERRNRVKARVIQGSSADEDLLSNSVDVMNLLRTNPVTDEPMMSEIGRSRFHYMAAHYAVEAAMQKLEDMVQRHQDENWSQSPINEEYVVWFALRQGEAVNGEHFQYCNSEAIVRAAFRQRYQRLNEQKALPGPKPQDHPKQKPDSV